MKNRFTTPKVKSYPLESGKEWYVWFRFNGGNPIRIKTGLNKIQDYNERLEEANSLAEVLEEKLKKGWNPQCSENLLERITIHNAFNQAIIRLKDKTSKNTYTAYSCTTRFFIEALKVLKYDKMLSSNFSRAYAKKCLEWITKDRNWSGHAFNKN